MAHRRLPRFALEYLEGGAEEEATLARNRAAFEALHFVPKTLTGVAAADTSTTFLGERLPVPFAIAPTGLNALFWRDADRELARAAAEVGIPFCQSTMSNERVEAVAEVPDLRHWWQLYVFGGAEVARALVRRAREADCQALVVTTDAQIYGNREWDHRNRSGPKSLTWSANLDALMHPRWLLSTIVMPGMPRFANVVEFIPEERRGFFDSAFWIRGEMERSLSWDVIARLRELWPRKLLVKGVLDPADAARAAEVGADGIVVSNHGGRQLDYAVSALDMLPDIRRAVGGRLAIAVDGGIRRGTDIVKALALGADLVLVGRAVLYGLAAGGRAGASRALYILRDELQRDLALLGAADLAALGPHLLDGPG